MLNYEPLPDLGDTKPTDMENSLPSDWDFMSHCEEMALTEALANPETSQESGPPGINSTENGVLYDSMQETIAQARERLQERMGAVAPHQTADSSSIGQAVGINEDADRSLDVDTEFSPGPPETGEMFEQFRSDFEAKTNPTLEEEILFQKAQNKESQRLNRQRNQTDSQEEKPAYSEPAFADLNSLPVLGSMEDQYQLFCSDDDRKNSTPGQTDDNVPQNITRNRKAAGRKPNPQNKIASKDKRRSAASGFDAFQESHNKKPKGKGAVRKRVARPSKGNQKISNKVKQQRRRQAMNMNFESLFSANVIQSAKANISKQEIPKFSAKAKDKALKELIANVPHADPAVIRTDRQEIMSAIVKFTKRPKADGKGSWLHPDMKTSLFHYQLIGVGFMRDRENSSVAPFGGFLCDEMGFGKTIQAIATIVDGQPSPEDASKITLIVVPSHLVDHWMSQLKEHCKPHVLGAILRHHAAEKISEDVFTYCLGGTGVILTTYTEVRKSYPEFEISPEIVKYSEKQTAWRNQFYNNCGIIHRINFHRIILDGESRSYSHLPNSYFHSSEAHEIKNHLSKTSMAVRMLSGQRRWVITGTPIHNNPLEFFPYFEFLRIPQTGNFHRFCRNYYPDGTANHGRLASLLRAYMLRRTHEETLFGLPILKLPDVDECTITIQFSKMERLIYEEIARFLVNQYMCMDEESGKYTGKWVLLQKLRMYTSHLLLAHSMLKDILTDTMMENLRLSVGSDATATDVEIFNLLNWITKAKALPSVDEAMEAKFIASSLPRCNAKIVQTFGDFLNSSSSGSGLHMCKKCKSSPYMAYIMPCMHIYCKACFPLLPKYEYAAHCVCGERAQDVAFCPAIPSLYKVFDHNKTAYLSHIGPSLVPAIPVDNWVTAAGHLMPSAKLTAIHSCVAAWINGSPDTKIVIFTQFLGMVTLLSEMCFKEGWGFATITGSTPASERHRDIEDFRNDPSVRVVISSLKAGGTGLSLTMAHKCILVDLWWNEAIEQQAFCRLFRYGQKKDVEIVRITVENSIDDRIQLIQKFKTTNIEKTMGADVLAFRDTLEDILKIFGVSPDTDSKDSFVCIP
ncbi:hypothetical protein LOZ66_003385 [Ophidiomyces ophidiicola]|nr:hypothetical protein LOZ66_003385 [Ophidiomyces ophidiicola]